jgi:cytochrome P450
MTAAADFTSQEYLRDPVAGIARLRALGAVLEVRFPIVGRVWITTTQELAGRVLKESETFTLRKDGGALAGLRWWIPGMVRAIANNMLTMDEPDHTRLQGIVDEALRRRAILDMEPRILAIANGLAGELFLSEPPPILSRDMRASSRLPSSASCSVCRRRIGRGSSFGRTASHASRGSWVS